MLSIYGETGALDDYDFRGRTDPEIVRALLRPLGYADARIDRSLADLWMAYCEALERQLVERRLALRVLPGVERLLDRFADDDRIEMALVTGNVERGAWLKLGACGLDDRFAFGAFGSDSESRSELPPIAIRRAEARTGERYLAEEVIVIGDTPDDIRCARDSGLRVLSVATGGHTREALQRHSQDHLVDDLTDTAAILRLFEAP